MTDIHMSQNSRARLKKRYRAERHFKLAGLIAVALSIGFLVLLLGTIARQAVPAFHANYLLLKVDLSRDTIDPQNLEKAAYTKLIKSALKKEFEGIKGRKKKREMRNLISNGSAQFLKRDVYSNPKILGSTTTVYGVPLDDFADLYIKGIVASESSYHKLEKSVEWKIEKSNANALMSKKEWREAVFNHSGLTASSTSLELGDDHPSIFYESSRETIKIIAFKSFENEMIELEGIVLNMNKARYKRQAQLRIIKAPVSERKISDQTIAWLDHLNALGKIENRWNVVFFSNGSSREPEQAGIWGAIVGSMLTMLVTLCLSFPLGVMAAIYLEEFAPKNKLTSLIEVNINNLAAVPSIVFGLLGLAVFLNWANLPRSAPLVGGLVLSLMTLPTIIIASRAALRAVPPYIRQAALGVGASKIQTVFHHVFPLAMPGVLTGTIIGMAQALGETAPLLMIGMVAFIVDVPGGFTDPATVLPVQIFMWADFPELGFQHKTAAAILILIVFLVLMNLAAVILRKYFERRW